MSELSPRMTQFEADLDAYCAALAAGTPASETSPSAILARCFEHMEDRREGVSVILVATIECLRDGHTRAALALLEHVLPHYQRQPSRGPSQ